MGKLRRRKPRRRRIGRVSIYIHHGRWWAYYREHGRPVRNAVADDEATAATVAAQINLELTASVPTLFSFRPISVAELQLSFLGYHEHVARSSLATVNRYRTASQHLVDYSRRPGSNGMVAHEVHVECFVRHLRSLRVAPNGHRNSTRRPLRDKGVHFIWGPVGQCTVMRRSAGICRPILTTRLLASGASVLASKTRKPIFVFDAATELRFLAACDPWSFGVHFLLAKTGLRVGELVHTLIEDVDLEGGWLQVRNRPELCARTKTRREWHSPDLSTSLHERIWG